MFVWTSSCYCLIIFTNTGVYILFGHYSIETNYGTSSSKNLKNIKTPDVVSSGVSVNLPRKVSIKGPWLFVSLVGMVICG